MHVLIIASWYKTAENPLQGTFFEDQARALLNRGIKVTVFYPGIELQFRSRFKNSRKADVDFNDSGLPTYYLFTKSITPRSRAINYLYLNILAHKKLMRIFINEGKPDIIHAHSVFSAGIVARFVSIKTRIPYIITEHFSGLSTGSFSRSAFNIRILRKVYKDARKAIMVSNFLRDELVKKYGIETYNVRVIPNMVNNLFFQKPAGVRASSEIVLLANSFLNENKNHKLLLDAFASISKLRNDVVLKIGGNGELMNELKQYVDCIGLGNKVEFLGMLTREEVKKNLDQCAIFLSTSKFETFSVVIIEALACGKPVVVTDSGGPRDIVGAEDGLLVKKHDPIAFSQAVETVLNNYQQYDSGVIERRCHQRFSEEKIVGQLINIYQS